LRKEAKKIAKSDEVKSKLKKILNSGNEKIFLKMRQKKSRRKLIHPKVWQKLNI
jgi:hypothetical protein